MAGGAAIGTRPHAPVRQAQVGIADEIEFRRGCAQFEGRRDRAGGVVFVGQGRAERAVQVRALIAQDELQ